MTTDQLREVIRENHNWHLSYDDQDIYRGSDLCNMNTDALGLPRLEETGA